MIAFSDHFGAGGTLPGRTRRRRRPEPQVENVPEPAVAGPAPADAKLVFDPKALVDRWKAHYTRIYQPCSPIEDQFVQMMAFAAFQVDNYTRYRKILLERVTESADECWKEDRREAAEKLATTLPKAPGRVTKALEKTKQGAEWKIERWMQLHLRLTRVKAWSEDERKHAFDLLGIPSRSRRKSTVVPAGTDVQGLSRLVSQEIRRLRELVDTVLDAADQYDYAEVRLLGKSPYDVKLNRVQKEMAQWNKSLRDAEKALLDIRKRRPPKGGPKGP